MKILQLNSSILGKGSVSSKYSSELVKKISSHEDTIIMRDLSSKLVTPLSGEVLGQLGNADSTVSKEYKELINEIKAADTLVISAPMYNFSIPTTLKNYFDAITRAGETFKYNEKGQAIGLLENKTAYVVISRGGKYKEHNMTFQEDYLKVQLGFIGITNVKFVFIEGVAMGATEEELNYSFTQQI